LAVFATVGESEHTTPSAGKAHLPILAIEHPTDLAVEALRSLRTSLQADSHPRPDA
jgi:hypothetical protein